MNKMSCFSVLLLLTIIMSFSYFTINAEEVPLINPLNNMELYEDLRHYTSRGINISYEDEKGESVNRTVRGEYWYYKVPEITDTDRAREDFVNYLKSLSVNILFQSDKQIYFNAADGPDIVWWGEAKFYNNYYRVYVIKEWNLIPGKTITNQVGGDIKHWIFKTTYEGNNFISFKITADSGKFTFKAVDGTKDMVDYERKFRYHKRINGNQDNYLDDIPQERGEHYWQIDKYDADLPVNISINIEELTELPVVKYGEEVGALRVKNVALGRVSVEPAGGVTIKHAHNPLFDEKRTSQGDRTPEGDTIFWLSPGFWKVRIYPKSSDSEEYETQMIPVSSGEMTVLEVPTFLNTAFLGSKGLEIISASENSGQGYIICKYTDKDKNKSPVFPENVEVYEGGEQGEITDIKAVEDMANVALLLDSSGSMKGQMEATIATARDFIQSLPENTNTQVIDFDTRPKLLAGDTREEVLKNLEGVKADGATALYDTILRGVDLLKDESSPVLLVFTDGVDANWDDSGPGSIATKDEVLSAVKESGIPLYTIGFGSGHDNSTLTELADISGGSYYPADDQTALADVFKEIKDNISYSYQITYNRPPGKDVVDSDVPVVSFVIDRSGSMGQNVGDSGLERLEVVKSLLRNFILELPENSRAQLACFNNNFYIKQILTDNKITLLQALGEIKKKGGTNVLLSVKTAVTSLRKVSSTKKVLLYVTDAALDVKKAEQEEFEQLLQILRKEEIGVLWIGLGMTDREDVFAYAAEVSGGDYLVSEDIDLLKSKFEEIMKNIKELPEDEVRQIPLRVVIKEKSDRGVVDMVSAGSNVSFPLMDLPANEGGDTGTENTIKYLDNIAYQTGLPFVRYHQEELKEISKESTPGKEILITKKIPLEVSDSNQAMLMKADEAYFITKINGVEVPRGKKLLALSLELDHILPEQEVIVYPDGSSHPASWINTGSKGEKIRKKIPYLIPDLSSHLFLN
ncbi:MAG: vWA domain-containing protein, partial [Halanaerobiales bacterium]